MSTSNDPLMVTISGVRGIWGTSLTPEVCVRYIKAFAVFLTREGGKPGDSIVLGSDTRESRIEICTIANSIFREFGFNVIYCGIVPTPTVQFGVKYLKARGGLIVTSSHNPIGWNGLKFVGSNSLFLNSDDCQRLFSIANTLRAESDLVVHTVSPLPREDNTVADAHLGSILSLNMQTQHIHSIHDIPKLRVALDTINGAGGVLLPRLLAALNCDVVHINSSLDGKFARTPEPVPNNLVALGNFIRQDGNFNIGLVCDPDADRLAILNENGDCLNEEMTLGLALDLVLNKTEPETLKALCPAESQEIIVVKNMSSSRISDDVVERYNKSAKSRELNLPARLIVTPVGEINVADKMLHVGSLIGGEGNGGVIFPKCHIGRDSLVATYMTLLWFSDSILERKKNVTLSELTSPLYTWFIYKDKVTMQSETALDVIRELEEKYSQDKTVRLTTSDGLKIDHPDWWVHIRTSNTEPIVRIFAEARTIKESSELVSQWKARLCEGAGI